MEGRKEVRKEGRKDRNEDKIILDGTMFSFFSIMSIAKEVSGIKNKCSRQKHTLEVFY